MAEQALIGVGVFVGAAGADWIWAEYMIAVEKRQAVRAGVLSAMIFAVGGSIITQYIHDSRMLVPAALGAFVGTVYAVCRKRKS